MQLTSNSGEKNLSPPTGKRHLLHSLVFLSLQRVKGYQALPLLTVCRRRVGGEPGNEAKFLPPPASDSQSQHNTITLFIFYNLNISSLHSCSRLSWESFGKWNGTTLYSSHTPPLAMLLAVYNCSRLELLCFCCL